MAIPAEDLPPGVQVKLLTLQFAPGLGAIDARPLEAFLVDKEVLALREHFFEVHGLPHLACLITYRLPRGRDEPSRPARRDSRARPERVELDAAEKPLFEALRAWRAERARSDGVPPYVIFSNRELCAIVQARPASANGLTAIAGVGPGKVERYGADVLATLGAGDGAAAPEAPA